MIGILSGSPPAPSTSIAPPDPLVCGAPPDPLVEDTLELAALVELTAEFEASIKLRSDFADGYAGAAGSHAWLIGLHEDDKGVMQEHLGKMERQLGWAQQLAPDTPRVLWVVGGEFEFIPEKAGGSIDLAIWIYARADRLLVDPPARPRRSRTGGRPRT